MSTLAEYFASHRARFVMAWRFSVDRHDSGFHSHEHFEIVYHLSGSGTAELADGARIRFEPHTVAVYPPRIVHNQVSDSSAEDCCIHLELDGTLPAELRKSLHLAPIEDQRLRDELVRLTDSPSRLDSTQALALDYRVTSALLGVLGGIRSNALPTASAESHAERAKGYLEIHFASVATMDDVARALGVSGTYLRHAFKDQFGVSLHQYLTDLRIERAKRLLEGSALPQKAIASLCGFANERYLSARFRQVVGHTPGEHRKRWSKAVKRRG